MLPYRVESCFRGTHETAVREERLVTLLGAYAMKKGRRRRGLLRTRTSRFKLCLDDMRRSYGCGAVLDRFLTARQNPAPPPSFHLHSSFDPGFRLGN